MGKDGAYKSKGSSSSCGFFALLGIRLKLMLPLFLPRPGMTRIISSRLVYRLRYSVMFATAAAMDSTNEPPAKKKAQPYWYWNRSSGLDGFFWCATSSFTPEMYMMTPVARNKAETLNCISLVHTSNSKWGYVLLV